MFKGLSDACSHLQNACRAKLGMTSLPNTRHNLNLCVALHRQGLISSVTRGGPSPPKPETILTETPAPATHSNVATRRLWVGLKYYQEQPVLNHLSMISTSTRRITMHLNELEKIARGRPVGYVRALTMGELLFLTTDLGVLEVREAIGHRRGGCLLYRVRADLN